MSAVAAVVIDQEAIVSTPPVLGRIVATIGDRAAPAGSPSAPLVNAYIGQSVTAGVAGILDTIEVQGPFWNIAQGSGHAFRLSLFSGTFGNGEALLGAIDVPVGAAISQAALNSAATFSVNVSDLGFVVTPGSQFSFSIALLGPPGAFGLVTLGNVAGTNQNPVFQYNDYAGGSAYYSNNGAPLAAIPRDIGFRTYVDQQAVNAVPEASTWLLMLAGFGFAGVALRRRRVAPVAAA